MRILEGIAVSPGAPFDERLPVGMMVETPAAALLLDRFAAEADFFSIGTNDLIQYSLAVGRNNPDAAHRRQACDPAVLRLIATAAPQAREAGAPISLCGPMGGGAALAPLLLGLGLRSLSAAPSVIPEVKQANFFCRPVRRAAGRSRSVDDSTACAHPIPQGRRFAMDQPS